MAGSRMRPLLLLDVDGVLMPVGRSVPPGFERSTSPTFDIVVSPQHGAWLHQLRELFDLVWATSWGDTANDTFGAYFGLPHLPSVPLKTLTTDGTRKLQSVAAYVGDRALAWIDDELYEDAELWAGDRDAPTLLIRTAASVGLRRDHVERLVTFTKSI